MTKRVRVIQNRVQRQSRMVELDVPDDVDVNDPRQLSPYVAGLDTPWTTVEISEAIALVELVPLTYSISKPPPGKSPRNF